MQLQRTILWIVFSMSLLFLWDNWQKHNGKPSMFGGATTSETAGKTPAGSAPAAGSSTISPRTT
jgi:YidC/Oxa1 family membrane protein insertase